MVSRGGDIFGGSIFSRLVLYWCIFGCRLVSVVLSQNECHNVWCWVGCTVCLCEDTNTCHPEILRDDPDFCLSSVRLSHPVASAFVPFKLLSQWVFVCVWCSASTWHQKKKTSSNAPRTWVWDVLCCILSCCHCSTQVNSKGFFLSYRLFFLFV